MPDFSPFHKRYAPDAPRKRPTRAMLRNYEKLLPGDLLELWKSDGLGSYSQGLLWLTDPAQWKETVLEWLVDSPRAEVIARTAFGDLFVWSLGGVQYLDVHLAKVYRVADDIPFFFNTFLLKPKNSERCLRKRLFKKCLKKLGPPKRSEAYTFVPALAFGGSQKAEFVELAKMREHLNFLLQLI